MEILSLGEKIKRKRKERNMTLKELAGDKVTAGQISLVESGKTNPSIDLLHYISKKMNISIDYMLETQEHQAEKLCDYYSKIAYGSLLAHDYTKVRDAINKIAAYANDYKLDYYKGLNELYSGMMEYQLNNFERAQACFITASEIFNRTENFREATEAYVQLGLTSYKLSYFNSALNYFKQAEKSMSEHNIVDDEQLMKIYFNISLCYNRLEDNQSSVDYGLLAMEKYKKRNDRFQYAQSLLILSLSYSNMNKYEEALLYAEKAVQVFKELDDKLFAAKMETNMGIILSDIGNIDDSFKHLQNAYRIELETHDKHLPYTMMRMADNYIKINEIDKAMDVVREAYEKIGDEGQDEYRVAIYYYFYKLYIIKKDNRNAELCLLEAIKYLKNLDMPKQLADIYFMLGGFYEENGNQADALKYYNKGIGICKKLEIIPDKNIY